MGLMDWATPHLKGNLVMSAPALAWVASIKVGNQTAKQLLQFYAAHNFNKPGFEFKIDTLAEQLETSKSSIQRAHKLLIEKGLIIKEPRYSKDGRQLSSSVFLNIPQEFVDNFFNKGGEGVTLTPTRVSHRHGEGVTLTPLYNNNINNKKNKREPAPKKRELLSQDFEFDEANQKLCAERKVDPPLVLGKFKAHMKASSKKSADWQAEAELWILRERPTTQEAKPKSNELRSNVKEYGPGHPTWDAMHAWDLKQALKRNSNEGNSIRRANL